MARVNTLRLTGLVTIAGGLFTILLSPLLATASYNLSLAYGFVDAPPFWLPPLKDLAGDLLTFAAPGVVYPTYGKLFFLVFALLLFGVFGLHLRFQEKGRRLENWGFWLLVIGFVMGLVGDFASYWEEYLGMPLGLLSILEIPGILLLLTGSVLYGIAMLKGRLVPAWQAWLLIIAGPGGVLFTLLPWLMPHYPAGPLFLVGLSLAILGYTQLVSTRGLDTVK